MTHEKPIHPSRLRGAVTLPFGRVVFTLEAGALIELKFSDELIDTDAHPCVNKIKEALQDYTLRGHLLSLRVNTQKGTLFQRTVWDAIATIPYGQTRTYQDVARAIGKPRAVRAVGQACKANPVALVVPCHRVVRSDGVLGGYSGKDSAGRKRALLDHEAHGSWQKRKK